MWRSRDQRTRRSSVRREAERLALRVVVFASAFSGTTAVLPRLALAQVGTIATSAPTLSPVGFWGTTGNNSGPVAQANTLTIRINAGATQTIGALRDNQINPFPAPVSVTTEWQLTNLISTVDLVGYFTSPAVALATTGATLPSSVVKGRMTTGRVSVFTPFTQNVLNGVGVPGGSLHLLRQFIIAPLNGSGQRTDNLELELDLRGLPNVPVGTYRGTLTLRAIAY